ncbi:universal stress protein [Nocardioides sp. HDW12B]|uniref:universal stress protein n=1 Tax=Nocardioides sp. HDW12B TaxID=2714939 RepID=UPI00140DE4D4|nr:universal stress protein [Nocardioides sp. HDW12B]QIK65973.1 universal stress protein [Nocardioides sp. HDW12B]
MSTTPSTSAAPSSRPLNGNDRVTVTVAVDGTASDRPVLRVAVAEAQLRGAELQVAHVAPPYAAAEPTHPLGGLDLSDVGREILDAARTEVEALGHAGVVRSTLVTGHRVPELVELSEGSGLLVVGRGGHGRVVGLLAGSVAVGLATHARCPVRVVAADRSSATARAPVVAGMSRELDAEVLLAHSGDAAVRAGTSLVVLHAWHLPSPYADRVEGRTHSGWWADRARTMVETALEPVRQACPHLEVEVQVVHDDPAVALLHASRDATLVVLTRPHDRRIVGGHLGRVARQVMAGSRCPVDVVPPGEH